MDDVYITNNNGTAVHFQKRDGRWHEQGIRGHDLDGWGGQDYMSYLTPDDLMGYLSKDYDPYSEFWWEVIDEEGYMQFPQGFSESNNFSKVLEDILGVDQGSLDLE